ncbi:SDR family oxidoreductase [Patescibacteria group bacterium]|nr:SDR family oxidoreductase [Patescibacteria group bacterium]
MAEKQVAIITGGSRGIGFETTKLFLERGYNVAFCGRSKTNVEQAEKELKQRGKLLAMTADVRDYGQVKAFLDRVSKKYDRFDVLVNNAAVLWTGDFARQAVKSINEEVDVNVKGVLLMTRAVLPKMREQKSGCIINVSSGAGKHGIARLTTYCATKFAVIGFTESLAEEVEKDGIMVYGICPGRVATDMQVQHTGEKVGMSPKKIAVSILKLAGPNPPIKPGECLEIYH